MSNSNLVVHTHISPNSTKRNSKITKITIHHIAGKLGLVTLGNVFAPKSRRASSNYGVDNNGRVGQYVREDRRAWTSGDSKNDHSAVTIEVANSSIGGQWPISKKAMEGLIDLCVDIIKRNPGIKKLDYNYRPSGTLTRHDMFQSTVCPGPYLRGKFPYIQREVNKRLKSGGSKPSKPSSKEMKYPLYTSPVQTGSVVRGIQKSLNELGYNIKVDSSYGPATDAAVRKFQRANKLAVDGQFGPATIKAMNKPKKGSSGSSKKSTKQVASEVIRGIWGNGQTRVNKLKKAGYNINTIQREVNRQLRG